MNEMKGHVLVFTNHDIEFEAAHVHYRIRKDADIHAIGIGTAEWRPRRNRTGYVLVKGIPRTEHERNRAHFRRDQSSVGKRDIGPTIHAKGFRGIVRGGHGEAQPPTPGKGGRVGDDRQTHHRRLGDVNQVDHRGVVRTIRSRYGERHGEGSRFVIGMDRVLNGTRIPIAEDPKPGGIGTGRKVREIYGQRSLTARGTGVEIRNRYGGEPAAVLFTPVCPHVASLLTQARGAAGIENGGIPRIDARRAYLQMVIERISPNEERVGIDIPLPGPAA